MALEKNKFGKKFNWGVSVAAYQIEGAHNIDGKGPSIWDTFTNTKGNTFQNENANHTTNFYYLYEHDLQIIKHLGIPNFRFSISWSRIFPDGTGRVNKAGVDYYNKLINRCLELEITPWVTLYHWDLPQALENKGGWTNREILNWFGDYVTFCVNTFGDRVKNWFILNEPMVFTGAGYFLGLHAPGKKGLTNFIPAMHHTALAQALGGKIIKSLKPKLNVGTSFSCSHIDPATDSEEDKLAAKRVDAILNRLFLEPSLGLGYPIAEVRMLRKVYDYMHANDYADLKFDFDFIGIQNYTREIVTHSYLTPFLQAKLVKAADRGVHHTQMGWEVHPQAINKLLHKFNAYEGVKKIIVSENGAAFPDVVSNNRVHDKHRVEYLQSHIKQVLKAKKQGVKVKGYFVWTLTDNFEWAEGYHPKFGLVHVNFETQQRIIKDSGLWYKNFLS
ncbi:MAG: hypothetical protein RLZZ175_1423 [Bacteroidota bacterium]|jgi:beta-glucosidase